MIIEQVEDTEQFQENLVFAATNSKNPFNSRDIQERALLISSEQKQRPIEKFIEKELEASKEIKIQDYSVIPSKIAQVQIEFNLDRIPPDWQYAEDHLNARVIGPEILTPPINICDCCGFNVNRKQMPLSCKVTELSFLGSGFPLMFVFIKYCAFIAMIFFLMSGLYNLISNALSDDCLTVDDIATWLRKKSEYQNLTDLEIQTKADKYAVEPSMCYKDFFSSISLANKKNQGKVMLAQGVMNFLTVITIIICLYIFRRVQRRMDVECDEANVSPSDFSIWIQNIPIGFDECNYNDDLKSFFEIEGKAKLGIDIEVKLISLGFHLEELEQLQKAKNQILKQKQKRIKLLNKNKILPIGDSPEELDAKIKKADENIQILETRMAQGISTKFCGTAFLSFNTEIQKNAIIKKFGIDAKENLVFKNSPLEIRQSPEPNAVLWYNLRFTKKEQFQRKLISFGITLILMGGSFTSIYYLNDWQVSIAKKAQEEGSTDTTKEKLLGIFISLTIVIINIILGIAIEYLSEFQTQLLFIKLQNSFEKYHVRTKYNISYAKKTSFIQFFNIAFIMFLVSLTLQENIIGRGGLIVNVSTLFIINSIVPLILQALRLPYYINIFLRKKYRKEGSKSCLTQKEAQEFKFAYFYLYFSLYEHPIFGIEQIYCEVLKTMFFSAFYFPLIPFGMLLTAIELGCLYWIIKFNLLRKSIVKFAQSALLSLEMTEQQIYLIFIDYQDWNLLLQYFQFSIFFKIIIVQGASLLFFLILNGIESEAIIHDYYKDKDNYYGRILAILIAGLAIGVINAAFPWQYVNSKIFPTREDEPLTITYDEARNDFDTNFNIENPATRRIAVKNLVQTWEKKDI